MKKILLFLVALVATLSMNAQTTEIHNETGKVASYLGADVTVKFGVAGDGKPTLEVYKGGELQKTYTGSEYKVVSKELPPTTGTAKATIGGNDVDVKWIQLWENGPKFAEYNVGVTDGKAESYGDYYAWGGSQDKVDDHNTTNTGSGNLTGTDDTATKLWGSNWRMPTADELGKKDVNGAYVDGLLGKCTCAWITNYNGTNVNGLLCKGKENTDYASNSVFFPAVGFYSTKLKGQGLNGYYWSSTPNGSKSAYDLNFAEEYKNVSDGYSRVNWYCVRPIYVEDPVAVTGVSLNKTELKVGKGNTETLSATVTPADATNKKVLWTSSDEKVATVDAYGKVTGVASGNCVITATTEDGNKTATCKVAVFPAAEPEYVEIGGVKWATKNLGAEKETDYGYYFAWGGTEAYVNSDSQWKSVKDGSVLSGGFSQANAPYYGSAFTKYTSSDSKTVLEPGDDAATALLGSGWRMPTTEEFKALYDACGGTEIPKTGGSTSTTEKGVYWCDSYDGVAGCLFCDGTNKLFFPAAGFGNGTVLKVAGDGGRYWSSSLYSDITVNACYLYFISDDVSPQLGNSRYYGFSVRPVKAAAAPLPAGALSGEFSVSATKKVHFSKGNLYYDGSAFNFEANQYDFQDSWNASHVSHFFWSKTESVAYAASYDDESGTAATDVFFTNDPTDAEKAKADFTVKVNGSDVTGVYRTLSKAEWEYLFKTRIVNGGKGSGKSYSLNITYGGKMGLVLYPDNYTGSVLSGTVNSLPEGVVFLPTAGFRFDYDSYYSAGEEGDYWSSSSKDGEIAYEVHFSSNDVHPGNDILRLDGCSVRLVTEVK